MIRLIQQLPEQFLGPVKKTCSQIVFAQFQHSATALIIGRVVPIVRTFVTVIAGVSEMTRTKFVTYSAVGAVLWVSSVTLAGYFLGTAFPWLGDKIDIVIILIVALSLVPVAIEWLRHRRENQANS